MRQRFWQGTFKTLGLLGLTAGLAAQAAEPSGKALSAAAGVPWPAVIAHRGASYDAPEETAAAYLLARDLGADYLEADVQRSRDGVLVALHDDTLERTTDVAEVFPGRAKDPVSSFSLAELKRLDAGSWFNRAFPERARPGFVGLRILTLDEMLDIAEGGRACTWRPRYRRNSPASKTTCASCWSAAAGCNPASAPPPGMSTWPTAMAG